MVVTRRGLEVFHGQYARESSITIFLTIIVPRGILTLIFNAQGARTVLRQQILPARESIRNLQATSIKDMNSPCSLAAAI
jgi:hypothetical protein